MSTPDVTTKKAFPLPVVDKTNLQYQAAVRNLNDQAVAYRRDNDFSSTIKKYNDAVMLDRNFAPLYNNRGVALLKRNAFAGAISDFNRALAIDPDFGLAYYNRGKLNLETGAEDRALEDFRMALKIDPDFARAYRAMSRLLKSKSGQSSVRHVEASAPESQN